MKHITHVPILGIFTIITFLTLTIISCRTIKHRFEGQQATQKARLSESQEWQHYIQQDSSKRYWSFGSDSAFFYHPDGGLWAQGGWLYTQEQSVHTKELRSYVSNSDSAVVQQHSSKAEQKTIRKNQLPWYIYLIVVLVISFGGYCYIWRKGFKAKNA